MAGTFAILEDMVHTSHSEFKKLARLDTPEKIQTFLEKIPFNHERNGETCMSPLRVLTEQRAHCIEGAFVAALCLMLHGEKPLIVNLKATLDDYDHIITVFRRNGYWGAISKTNHLVLRYRDPVYRSIRELAMSYFHEYFLLTNGKKTLLGHTKPINLRTFGSTWITAEEDLWDIAEKIYDTPYISMVPKVNAQYLRRAQQFERNAGSPMEWNR